jgi:carboxypeptidase C (cathepsin A)
MLYLSQPIGVGFSYSTEGIGWMDDWSGDVYPPNVTSLPFTGGFGRWPLINASAVDTTELAAIVAYHTIQGLFSSLPQFDSEVQSRSFNLWTESYGGHYGPVFYDYFYEQNQAIANGSVEGVVLDFDSLGIGNGLIDYAIQGTSIPRQVSKVE